MFTRYFRTNLRPVVISIGIAATIYSLIWAGSAFSDINTDRSQNVGQLVPFDITLGTLYIVVALIEMFGVFGALRQNLPIVRLYAMGSLLASVIIFGAEILRLVVHFKFKQNILTECITLAQTDGGIGDDHGFVGNRHARKLTPEQAIDFCNSAWSHDTFSDIAWLIISSIVSLVFASLAYSYYRQLLDPQFGVARFRPQGNSVPLDTFRNYNNNNQYGDYAAGSSLPYNAGMAPGRRSPAPSEFIPPYESSKLPGYGETAGDPDKKAPPTDEEKDLSGISR